MSEWPDRDPGNGSRASHSVECRPYDPADVGDRETLWRLKRSFETDLGTGTGDDDKRATYAAKLTDDYRSRWLAWVDRCVADDERCVTLAVVDDDVAEVVDDEVEGNDSADVEADAAADLEADSTTIAGYVFVLPERLAYIWDAAVVNEIYVAPEWRGTGVADALLEAAVDLAVDQDLPLERLLLDVDPDNERAYAFYERHGFEPWGEIVARKL